MWSTLAARDLVFAPQQPALVYHIPVLVNAHIRPPVGCGGMQRSGTRLLDILTTAAKHISICSSGSRVLGARAPYRAAYSSAHYRFTDTAFHCDRIGGAAHPDHSIPSLWQPLADQRRYKSKKKAGRCMRQNVQVGTSRMQLNTTHGVQVKRAKAAVTLQTRR